VQPRVLLDGVSGSPVEQLLRRRRRLRQAAPPERQAGGRLRPGRQGGEKGVGRGHQLGPWCRTRSR
jgi:hypothetical protein